MRVLPALSIFILWPAIASAQTLFQVAGALNIFVGLMATAAVVVFAAGLGFYFARMGLANRVVGIHIMEWGVAILFVLIVLLALVRFIRLHTGVILGILSFVVFIGLVLLFIHIVSTAGKKKEE